MPTDQSPLAPPSSSPSEAASPRRSPPAGESGSSTPFVPATRPRGRPPSQIPAAHALLGQTPQGQSNPRVALESEEIRKDLGVKNLRPTDRSIPILSTRFQQVIQALPFPQGRKDSTLHLCDRALKSLMEMSATEKRDALLSGLANYAVADPARYLDRYPRSLLDDLDGLNVTEEMEDLLLLLVLDTPLATSHRMLAVLLVRSQIPACAAALLTSRLPADQEKNESAFG